MRHAAAALVLSTLLLLAPTVASLALPEDWRAEGQAAWGACLGTLTAGAIGPMLAGEHEGEWWFWVDVDPRDEACGALRREGWIDSPYAKHPQVLRSDAQGGSLVLLHDEEGARSLELYEWRVADNAPVETLRVTSALRESTLL